MGSIPIYWGDPHIDDDFNPDCLINVHRFANWDAVIDEVRRIDSDDELWRKYVTAPIFRNDELPERLTDAAIMNFCKRVFSDQQPHVPASRRFSQRLKCKLRRRIEPIKAVCRRWTHRAARGLSRVVRGIRSRVLPDRS